MKSKKPPKINGAVYPAQNPTVIRITIESFHTQPREIDVYDTPNRLKEVKYGRRTLMEMFVFKHLDIQTVKGFEEAFNTSEDNDLQML